AGSAWRSWTCPSTPDPRVSESRDGDRFHVPGPAGTIEAEPGKIRSGADDLDEPHNDMLGQSGDTDAQMRSSADQFTDRIAWDIGTYMTERAAIVSRWETAKENSQTSPDMGGRPTPTAWNGPGRASAPNMRVSGHGSWDRPSRPRSTYAPGPARTSWNALSEEEREQVMANEPDLLRGLDEIPSDVRDQLDQEHLVDSHGDIEDKVAELDAELDDLPNAPGNSGDRSSLEGQIEELESQKTSMETLHGNLGDSAEDSNKYLLAFERDKHGRA